MSPSWISLTAVLLIDAIVAGFIGFRTLRSRRSLDQMAFGLMMRCLGIWAFGHVLETAAPNALFV